MYKTTVNRLIIHDGADFPYFTADVDIREDMDIKTEGPIFSMEITVFIDRDDSLPLDEIKKRAVSAAYKFLSQVKDAHSA